jgi:hypothetical protein
VIHDAIDTAFRLGWALFATLYALTGCVFAHAAIVAAHRRPWPYTGLLAGAACCLAIATIHHSYLRDEIRHLLHQLDATERALATERTAREDEDGLIAVAMAAWCCDAWAATASTEHDPATCTREDRHA